MGVGAGNTMGIYSGSGAVAGAGAGAGKIMGIFPESEPERE
jgi:hypothetical protein